MHIVNNFSFTLILEDDPTFNLFIHSFFSRGYLFLKQ